MQDVRGVFGGLAILIVLSLGVIVVATARSRAAAAGPATRARMWQAVGRAGRWLAIAMVVVGVLSLVAFDAAFELFHELLFPAGSFSFDPRTERLVQLFPDQFWSETSLALGVVAIALGLVTWWFGARRAAAAARAVASAADSAPSTADLPRQGSASKGTVAGRADS
jgi:integral membrane protein (TIGR01906 family)